MPIHTPPKNTRPNWLFYVASAKKFGGGHIMRSLQLAKAMKEKAEIVFILDDEANHWPAFLQKHGEKVIYRHDIRKDYDGLWVDHYQPDQNILQTNAHTCAGIFDHQPPFEDFDFSLSYMQVQANLSGLEYALVDPDYAKLIQKPSGKTRYTICFGQTDSKGMTRRLLENMESCRDLLDVNVVCGALNPDKKDIRTIAKKSKHTFRIHAAPPNLLGVFRETDILITSGGVTTLEACAAGIPTIVITVAENQIAQSRYLENEQAILYAGTHENLSHRRICHLLDRINKADDRQKLVKHARRCVDGQGPKRVSDALLRGKHLKRKTFDHQEFEIWRKINR